MTPGVLTVLGGADRGKTFPLGGQENRIGRGADQCELVVPHPTVSRRHAKLSLAGEALQIEDLGSTNGTAVNGVVLRAGATMALQAGSKLRLGDVELLIQHI